MREEFQGHKYMLELSLAPTLLGCRCLSLLLCYLCRHNQAPVLSSGSFPTGGKGPGTMEREDGLQNMLIPLFLAFQVLEVPWVTFWVPSTGPIWNWEECWAQNSRSCSSSPPWSSLRVLLSICAASLKPHLEMLQRTFPHSKCPGTLHYHQTNCTSMGLSRKLKTVM